MQPGSKSGLHVWTILSGPQGLGDSESEQGEPLEKAWRSRLHLWTQGSLGSDGLQHHPEPQRFSAPWERRRQSLETSP